ncbi:hypothetical protein COP2_024265 [Malus domestica]
MGVQRDSKLDLQNNAISGEVPDLSTAISTFFPSHGRHERTKRVRAPEQEAKTRGSGSRIKSESCGLNTSSFHG